MEDWYFRAKNNQRLQTWQEITRNTMDPRLQALRIVPPPSPGGTHTTVSGTPLLAVAQAVDPSTVGSRSANPYQQHYKPPTASSLPMGDGYASATLQGESSRAPDLLGSRRPTPPGPHLPPRFPPGFRPGGPQRPAGHLEKLTEGARQKTSRLTSGSVHAASAPPTIAISKSTTTVSNHGSRPPRFQHRPALHTASPSTPRYVKPPPGFHYYNSQSQPSREQGGRYQLPSRHGSSVDGGIQASSSSSGGSRQHVSTELCDAILAGAARLAQESPLTSGSAVDVVCMGPSGTASAQSLDTFTAMARDGRRPIPLGRGYPWDRQIVEPSYPLPIKQATSSAPSNTAHQSVIGHAWIPAPSQVKAADPYAESPRNGSSQLGCPHLSINDTKGGNFGDNKYYNVRGSGPRQCSVCGKVYTLG